MNVRKNDKKVIAAAAAAAGLPTTGFFVEVDHGILLVNHPDSMKWSAETRAAVKAAVEEAAGMKASVT